MSFIHLKSGSFTPNVFIAKEYNLKSLFLDKFHDFTGSNILVNANFFDKKGDPLGLIIKNNKLIQNIHKTNKTLTGIIYFKDNIAKIINTKDFNSYDADYALQAGPILISNKIPLNLDYSLNLGRRAGLCVDNEQNIILFCTSGILGISLLELQESLLKKNINCVDAINFDGGGSAQLYYEGSKNDRSFKSIYINGKDEVPVALGFFYH